MDKLNDVYRCNVCGHIIEIVKAGAGQLVCCGTANGASEGKLDRCCKGKTRACC